MKLLVIFASHRLGGENIKIEAAMKSVEGNFEFDFVHLADNNIHSCMACLDCAETGRCVLPSTPDDKFQEIFDKMLISDAIFIISPVYAGIPSRLTALFERMISILFFSGRINTDNNPLLGKKAAIFSYASCGICDETPIKLIFDKFVMKNYKFDCSMYEYLNNAENPKAVYKDITEYVLDTLKSLK